MSKKLIKDFAGYTTFHGLGFIVQPGSSIIRRLLWMCLFTLCMSLMIYQVSDRVMYYHSNPVNMNYRRIKNSTLRFPAVTFCNKNRHKVTSAAAMGLYDILKKSHSHSELADISTSNITRENITWKEVMLETAHKKQDFIHRCYFGDKECSHEDFNMTITDYGVCYTFNKDDRDDHVVSLPGAEHGLHLTFNVEAYDYLLGEQGSAGVKMLVHESDDTPLIKSSGHDFQVGDNVLIGVTTVITKNLPEPYGVCENKELQFFEKKTKSNCLTECRAKRAVELCGCRLPSMPGIDEFAGQCSLHQYFSCMKQALGNLENVGCDCPLPCQQKSYDLYTSNTTISESALKKVVDITREDRMLDNILNYKETLYRMGDDVWQSLITSFEEEIGNYSFVLETYRQYAGRYIINLDMATWVLSDRLPVLNQLAARFNNSWSTIENIKKTMSPVISETYISSLQSRFGRLITTEKQDVLYELVIDMIKTAKEAHDVTKMLTEDDYADGWLRSQLPGNIADIFHHFDVFIEMADESYYNRSLNESSIFEACKFYRHLVQTLFSTLSRWETDIGRVQAGNAYLITKLQNMKDGIQDELDKLHDLDADKENITLIFIQLEDIQKTIENYTQNNSRKIEIANMLISQRIEDVYDRLAWQERNRNVTERIIRVFMWTLDFDTITKDACGAISEFERSFYIPKDITLSCSKVSLTMRYYLQLGEDTKHAMRQLQKTFQELMKNSKDYNESIHINNTFIRKNFLEVSIFFRSMRYEAVDQQQGYNIFALLCDIGGSMGLLVGGSVLSLFEILDLIIQQVYLKRNKQEQREQSLHASGNNNTSLSVINQRHQFNKDITKLDNIVKLEATIE